MRSFLLAFKTNMPFDTALRLGVLAKDIPVESIKHGVIDYSMVALDEYHAWRRECQRHEATAG